MKLSIIIPVFRGGNILKELYLRIWQALSGSYDFEVLFICDGCNSASFSVLKEMEIYSPDHIRSYYFARNLGQHKAIQFGLGEVTGDFIITMDEDMQHDPEDIFRFIEKQSEGDYDVVYGRFTKLKHKWIKNWFSKILRKVLKYFIPALYEYYSPFRLLKKDVAIKIKDITNSYILIDDLISRITQNFAFVEITHHPSVAGRSSYTLPLLFKHGFLIIINYSGIGNWLMKRASIKPRRDQR